MTFHIYPFILVTWTKAATMKADKVSEVWTKPEGDASKIREYEVTSIYCSAIMC